jgi:cyclophilin family peptidyl-prolyl cis-trans isomerase
VLANVDYKLTRRSLIAAPLVAALVGLPLARGAWAGEPTGAAVAAAGEAAAAAAANPAITQRVELNVAVQLSGEETARKRIVVGLYGKEAPEACRIFVALANGALEAPCRADDSENEALQRAALTTRGVTRNCFAEESTPVTYTGSVAWRIVKGQRVDLGQVKGKFAQRVAPSWPAADASSRLLHDRAGLLSVPRGGGTFDFGLTLAPQPALDAGMSHVVIGEVVEGMGDLMYLNGLPVVNYAGQGAGSEASRAKQCFYGSADTFCSQGKPLKKCTLSTVVL